MLSIFFLGLNGAWLGGGRALWIEVERGCQGGRQQVGLLRCVVPNREALVPLFWAHISFTEPMVPDKLHRNLERKKCLMEHRSCRPGKWCRMLCRAR